MTSLIQPNFENQRLRVVVGDGGDPWFVAKDVSDILGYRNAPDMTRMLDDDEKGRQTVLTSGGNQEMTVINESGLYSCIFRSRREGAQRFRKWVTADLLPSIRRAGSYSGSARDYSVHALKPATRRQIKITPAIQRAINRRAHSLTYAYYDQVRRGLTTALRAASMNLDSASMSEECLLDLVDQVEFDPRIDDSSLESRVSALVKVGEELCELIEYPLDIVGPGMLRAVLGIE